MATLSRQYFLLARLFGAPLSPHAFFGSFFVGFHPAEIGFKGLLPLSLHLLDGSSRVADVPEYEVFGVWIEMLVGTIYSPLHLFRRALDLELVMLF